MAEVAWKRLNATDYKNINGGFANKKGGGATYIVLGRSFVGQNFIDFFPALEGHRAVINGSKGPLTVSSDPDRRKGEWLILDQRGDRHPIWKPENGFPGQFDANDEVVALIFREGDNYVPGWLRLSKFEQLAPNLAKKKRGVNSAPQALLAHFDLDTKSALIEFAEAEAAEPDVPFDPANTEDARKRVLAAVVRRQGQKKFRADLLNTYDSKCAMTGCDEICVLEAAHISPYRGPDTNKADNGLLLRADLHTLFDLGLLAVNPDTLEIRVAQQVTNPEYRALDGSALKTGNVMPSKAALQEHWDRATP